MKNTLKLLAGSLLLSACNMQQTGPLLQETNYNEAYATTSYEQNRANEPSAAIGVGDESVYGDESAYVAAPVATAANVVYNHDVALREHDETHVTYEYKNMRIDEVASLAIDYCDRIGGKKAFLVDILLYHNRHRRATFECGDLATEK